MKEGTHSCPNLYGRHFHVPKLAVDYLESHDGMGNQKAIWAYVPTPRHKYAVPCIWVGDDPENILIWREISRLELYKLAER